MGIPRGTIRDWAHRDKPPGANGWGGRVADDCPRCGNRDPASLTTPAYVYLLGLYLGDGCISHHSKGVFILRVSLDNRYPGIIRDCIEAMASCLSDGSGRLRAPVARRSMRPGNTGRACSPS